MQSQKFFSKLLGSYQNVRGMWMEEEDLDSRKWIPKLKMKNSQGEAVQKTWKINYSDCNKGAEVSKRDYCKDKIN